MNLFILKGKPKYQVEKVTSTSIITDLIIEKYEIFLHVLVTYYLCVCARTLGDLGQFFTRWSTFAQHRCSITVCIGADKIGKERRGIARGGKSRIQPPRDIFFSMCRVSPGRRRS